MLVYTSFSGLIARCPTGMTYYQVLLKICKTYYVSSTPLTPQTCWQYSFTLIASAPLYSLVLRQEQLPTCEGCSFLQDSPGVMRCVFKCQCARVCMCALVCACGTRRVQRGKSVNTSNRDWWAYLRTCFYVERGCLSLQTLASKIEITW